uniref:Peptidase A1 domain-containing protein n=1 Tax=Angiostrongylus cantonensis TaxID=6313 RepID=A0A0K0CYH2_ANGCA
MMQVVKVLDYGDHEYFGNITVDTHNQQFTVVLDTGSAMFWVPGTDCRTNIIRSTTCYGRHEFVPFSSTTFVKRNETWLINYHIGEPKGILGTDTILLDKPIFTVWMAEQGTAAEIHGGLFTYGGIDTMNCGPVIAYEPIVSSTHYQLKMSAIEMRNYTHSKVYKAVVDTGTPLIGGPKVVIQKFADAAGAVYNATDNIYRINCNASDSTLDFVTGKNMYAVEAANYILKSKKCYFAIFSLEWPGFGPEWVLGTPFIRQFCSISDIRQKEIEFSLSL